MATESGTSEMELPPNIIMKDSNTYFCKCCSCILGGIGCMKQHVAGKRHKKEMQRISIVTPPSSQIIETNIKPVGIPMQVFSGQSATSLISKLGDPMPHGFTETSSSSKVPSGIVESTEKWNCFHCTFCNCVLAAGDLSLHVGGKRHTKKANQIALENFISKRSEKNISAKTENAAFFTAICEEGKDGSKPVKSISYGQQIPPCSMEELDELVKKKNVNAKKDAENSASSSELLSASKINGSATVVSELKSDLKEGLKTVVSNLVVTGEKVTRETAEKNALQMISHETNGSSKTIPERNASVKAAQETNTFVKTATEINASLKAAQKANASVKDSPEINTSIKAISRTNASVKTIAQTDTSVKSISKTNELMKATPQTNTSAKAIPQTDTSVKTTTQMKAPVKATTQMKAPVKATTQMKAPVKITTQTDASVKTASQTDASMKCAPQTHVSVKIPQTNVSVKIPQTNASVKIPQTNASVKIPQTNASVKIPQTNASVKIPQTNVSVKIPQTNAPVKIPQTNASVKISQTNVSAKISQTNASVKTTPQTNASVKTVSQTGSSMKAIPQKKSSVTSQTNASVKAASQTDSSVKAIPQKKSSVTSQTYSSVKATQHTIASEKITRQINASVKATPQMNASGKDTSQTIASVKEIQQTNASVKTDLQVAASVKAIPQVKSPLQAIAQSKSSLNEYLATMSNPIVGLNYVVETQMSNGQSRFQCNLCKVNGNTRVIKDHINASKHYLEYLKTVDPIKAAEVKALKETERNQKILEHVTDLERKKGRGTILVKTPEMKTITDDENGKDDSKKTVDTTVKELRNEAASCNDSENSAIQIVAQEFLSKDVIRNAQKNDPRTSKIIKELIDDVPNSLYIMHDGILYERRNGKYRVVVAQRMKQAIYESYHFSLCRKTPGAVTYINDSYSWSGINEDITKFAKQCYVCQIRKLRQLSDGEAIPILVRRGQGKKAPSPSKRTFSDLTNEEIEDTQRWDPDTIKLIYDIENGLETNKYIVHANILYILDENGQYKIVVSPQMKKLIFEKNHSMLCWKSTERPPVINAITQVYFWQRMLEEVKLFAAKCKKCRIKIPVKRIAEQKTLIATSAKIIKRSTEKAQDAVTKVATKEKIHNTVTNKDTPKDKTLDEPKEKSTRNIPWDKTKSLKPPIVEQEILTKDIVRDAQKKDLTTSKIIKLLMEGVPSSSYIVYEGVLYQEKNERYLTMVADKMKQTIYEKCHSSLCSRCTSRSSQRDGTKYINRHFAWPAMSQDIYIFVKNCHVCQVRTLRTKAFSCSSSSEERRNNKVVISASRSAFNDLTDDEITAAQQKDPDTLKILHQIEEGVYISRYILYEDILYCQGGHGDYKVVITPEMKEIIYQNNHFLLCWESTEWQNTVDMIAQVYLWPRIHEDIRDFMESCQICKREISEQPSIDPMIHPAALPDGNKTSINLVEQYPSAYSDPTYYSATQQYQSNYPVQSVDPYTTSNSAAYPYGTYPQYWNMSSDAMVTYPTLSLGTSYWESATPGAKEQDFLLTSGKRPIDDDVDPHIKECSSDSYSQRKRHRSDLDTEYDYSGSQNDKLHSPSLEAEIPLDQNMPLPASQFQHSPVPTAEYQSEIDKPIEAENCSNVLGFAITNAEDAEVTLDIINSLMQIYLKYQLKKLHGPVQKLLQETLKEEENNSNQTSHVESAVSNTSEATNIDTNELFVRLPRLHKSERTEVKRTNAYSVRTSSESFHQPSFGQHPYNQSAYASPPSATLKSDKSFTVPLSSSRESAMDTSYSKESDSPKTSSFFQNRSYNRNIVDKSLSTQNDDDIDGFPMANESTESKVASGWEDDIDGRPLTTESTENTEHIVDIVDSITTKGRAPFDHFINPVRGMKSPSLQKHLQKRDDDDIDGVPVRFRTSNLFNKSQSDLKALPPIKTPSSSSNKSEGSGNNNKDGPFLKPDSTKIFKKPPDDWDKNANKTSQTIKSSPFVKPQINWSESGNDTVPDTKAFTDKYPNWKKGGIQGSTSFYNSPLYNKANEGGTSANSSNAPVIDLFKRYRRVQH